MNNQEILAPVVALALWTMVMWLWMYATRIPAMQKQRSMLPGSSAPRGGHWMMCCRPMSSGKPIIITI